MTRAVGKASTAWGDGTDANGDWSTAFGSGTEANGAGSTAFGFKATANGHSSTAIGSSITVNGYNSVGIGLRDYMFANGQLRPEAPILHESNTFAVMGGTVKICDENAVCIDDLQQKIAEQDQLIVELTENVNFLMSQRN